MKPDSTGRTAGVILAAGRSTRMGRNKLLLEVGGEPLLRRVACTAIGAGLNPVIVVLGFEAQRTRRTIDDLGCTAVVHDGYSVGQDSSLRAGVHAVPGTCDAVCIMLADMPLVTSAMLEALIARYLADSPQLVVSRYGDIWAPPVLYDRALFAELTDPDSGNGKLIIRRHMDEAAILDWPRERLRDIDVPADYDAVKTLQQID